MRIDRWLWHTRFFKTRTLATKLASSGKVRVNGTLIAKPHFMLAVGDTLTFPQNRHIRVVKVLSLPERRGPAPEAQACYDDLQPPEAENRMPEDRVSAAAMPAPAPEHRPSPRDRRALSKLRGKD
jgi:ribosome-associated heat shock protein Hsp15